MAEAPSKETFTSGVEPEPTYACSEEDEDSEIPLRSRSRRTRGPTLVTIEELLKETAERQVIRDEPVPSLVPTKIALRLSSGSREKY